MKNTISDYIRVGTEYLKEVQQPLISGDSSKCYVPWKKQTIVDDFGRDALKKIKKYEGFCTIPNNINYEREIKGFINKYEALSHSNIKHGEWDTIKEFLHHIFEEQFDIGLDYLTILWQYPTQILPILCLVSSERNTGKTTFLNLLKLIFEGNMTINKNEDFRSRFNQDWASKLIIAVDEVLLDRKEDSERIKNLSTSQHYKSEGKGIDKTEIEFFGKFILCSNNEENFIKTDKNEIRYWVRKVQPYKKENPNLLSKMKSEIPHFLHFITSRYIETQKTTRMWFSTEQIQTTALRVLIKGNESTLKKELEEFITSQFHDFEVDELHYTLKDLINELKESNQRIGQSYLSKILKEEFELKPKENSSNYVIHKIDQNNSISEGTIIYQEKRKGRYYTFKKEQFIKTSVD